MQDEIDTKLIANHSHYSYTMDIIRHLVNPMTLETLDHLGQCQKGDVFQIMRCSKPGTIDLTALEMGIHPNAEGRVLQRHSHALVVNIDGTRMGIGLAQASRIQIQRVKL